MFVHFLLVQFDSICVGTLLQYSLPNPPIFLVFVNLKQLSSKILCRLKMLYFLTSSSISAHQFSNHYSFACSIFIFWLIVDHIWSSSSIIFKISSDIHFFSFSWFHIFFFQLFLCDLWKTTKSLPCFYLIPATKYSSDFINELKFCLCFCRTALALLHINSIWFHYFLWS